MSNAPRYAPGKTSPLGPFTMWSVPRVIGGAVLALLLVSLGHGLGVRSPLAAHHPRTVSGTAQRVPAEVPLAYFDPEDGDRVSFRLDDVVWRSGDRSDSGSVPPCLRDESEQVELEVGIIEVVRPSGQARISGSCR